MCLWPPIVGGAFRRNIVATGATRPAQTHPSRPSDDRPTPLEHFQVSKFHFSKHQNYIGFNLVDHELSKPIVFRPLRF